MNYMPFQPITPLNSEASTPIPTSLSQAGPERNGHVPFENYMAQYTNGINDGIYEYAGNFVKLVTGNYHDRIQHIPIVAYQASLMVKLATVVASKVTSSVSSLMQMNI